MTTELPNFDVMEPTELWAFYGENLGARPVKNARAMFPNNPKGRVKAYSNLRCYAVNKACAIKLRREGSIASAQKYEKDLRGHLRALARFCAVVSSS